MLIKFNGSLNAKFYMVVFITDRKQRCCSETAIFSPHVFIATSPKCSVGKNSRFYARQHIVNFRLFFISCVNKREVRYISQTMIRTKQKTFEAAANVTCMFKQISDLPAPQKGKSGDDSKKIWSLYKK